jgi:hypothetical protein
MALFTLVSILKMMTNPGFQCRAIVDLWFLICLCTGFGGFWEGVQLAAVLSLHSVASRVPPIQ